MVVCIFTPHGKTFTFRDVTISVDNETVLVLEYTAMSDGKRKRHTSLKANIVGWSVTEEMGPPTGPTVEEWMAGPRG